MTSSLLLSEDVTHRLEEIGQQLRVDSVRSSAAASSGHPTSSMSAADLMAVLLARHLRYDFADPRAAGNDHLIFSKGHASPLPPGRPSGRRWPHSATRGLRSLSWTAR